MPTIAVGARRLHDTNRSGWWLIVPVFNFVFLCEDSHTGANQYGPSSKPSDINEKASVLPIETSPTDAISQLEKLADLKSKGHLTGEEFAKMKKRLLGG